MADLPQRPLPDARGAGAEYWARAARGTLVLPRCDACGRVFWHPRPRCPLCASDRVSWSPASGEGTIHTFTIVRQSGDAYFRERVPYVVAMIDLDEGPRIMANVVGDAALDARIGERVKVGFEIH